MVAERAPRSRRTVADRAADRAVLRALATRGGSATTADIVVAAALPEATVSAALDRLLDRFESAVRVAKGGALVYRFARGPGGRFRPRRERRPVLRAFLRGVAVAWHETVLAVRIGFRTLLALQLLVYTFAILAPISAVIGAVVGLVVGVVLLVAAVAEGGDASAIELLFNPYVLGIFATGAMLWGIVIAMKMQHDVLLTLVGKDAGAAGGLAGFVKQINDFALGPEERLKLRERLDRTWVISHADERRVLARIRAAGGRLRAGDLVAWLGLGLEQAERQATRIAVEYGGEPAAESGGEPDGDEEARGGAGGGAPLADSLAVVEFQFPSLLATAGAEAGAARAAQADAVQTTWERGVALPALTGNARREDLAIVGFAALNLTVGLIALHFIDAHVARGTAHPTLWAIARWGGGLIPAGFALLLGALLLLRVPLHYFRRWRAGRTRERAAILDRIVALCRRHGRKPIDLEKLAGLVESQTERRTGDDVRTPDHATMRRVALELEGAFDLDAGNDPTKTVWRFPRLAAELAR